MKRALAALLFVTAASAADVETKTVASPRVRAADLGGKGDAEVAPAPQPGASRLFSLAELAALGIHARTPVRVVRKSEELDGASITRLVRQSIALPGGVSLVSVQPPARATIAAGYERARVNLPKLPKRAGLATSIASVSFEQDGAPVSRLEIPVVLQISAEAAVPDIARGASLALVLVRGLVRIETQGTALADGDAGDVIQVTARATGKTLRARVVDAKTANVLEGS